MSWPFSRQNEAKRDLSSAIRTKGEGGYILPDTPAALCRFGAVFGPDPTAYYLISIHASPRHNGVLYRRHASRASQRGPEAISGRGPHPIWERSTVFWKGRGPGACVRALDRTEVSTLRLDHAVSKFNTDFQIETVVGKFRRRTFAAAALHHDGVELF